MTGMIRMSSSTVLVYEFFTGGGCLGKDIPADLAIEALGMIWALLTDFKHWGEVRTIAALDSHVEDRIPGLNRTTLPADQVISISEDCPCNGFGTLLELCDAVLIIAPETDNILAALTKQAEDKDIPVLGSCSSAAALTGNKALCHDVFLNRKLPSPQTRCLPFDCGTDIFNLSAFPLVLKPLDGAGSDGVCCVQDRSEINKALRQVRQSTSHNQFLLQPYVAGRSVSVSVLASRDHCMAISLNEQLMETGSQLKYMGSRVPFQSPLARDVSELACSAVRSIPGLQGYVGVDLVLTEGVAQLIEINPRLTTSYIGLRQVSRVNLAEAIFKACLHGMLPEQIPISGQVTILKNDFRTWGLSDRLMGNLAVQG